MTPKSVLKRAHGYLMRNKEAGDYKAVMEMLTALDDLGFNKVAEVLKWNIELYT